jgi:hypothetical protein
MNHARLMLLGAVFSLVAALPAAAGATDAGGTQAVSCQLPPQIRRLGQHATYLAAGRIVTTTAADCRVRGGQARALRDASAAVPVVTAADAGTAVMVGGDRKADACPVSGEIIGLKAGSTLTVRAGPGTQHARQDRLANGRRVFVCDGSADEAWLGIVYPATEGQDCGVDTPVRKARPYAGPCAVGWVSAGWVRTQAADAPPPD